MSVTSRFTTRVCVDPESRRAYVVKKPAEPPSPLTFTGTMGGGLLYAGPSILRCRVICCLVDEGVGVDIEWSHNTFSRTGYVQKFSVLKPISRNSAD